MNHLGAPLAFRLGLPGDGADHRFGEVHLFDFDVGDLDSPGIGLRIERLLDIEIQLFAFGQHVVEVVLAEH